MIYYFTDKRAFDRRITFDRRDVEMRPHEDINSLAGEKRFSERRLSSDRRIYNKGFTYRWTFIDSLFD